MQCFIFQVIKREIVEPLCRDIETDLRLHIHTKHLDHMQALNPKTDTLRPLRPFLEISPLRVLGIVVNIKSEVEHYLDRTFYNLTTGGESYQSHIYCVCERVCVYAQSQLHLKTLNNFVHFPFIFSLSFQVALHDWRTYSDMRSLAEEKLGLSLMDNFLPMGSLDQGLDVLQIMRNIHIFVGRYVVIIYLRRNFQLSPIPDSHTT